MKMFPPNPKDWTEDSNHENGNYTCICTNCGSQFVGHKRRVTCKECAMTPQDPTTQDRLIGAGTKLCDTCLNLPSQCTCKPVSNQPTPETEGPTPETNEHYKDRASWWKDREFAETLERQRNAARAELERVKEAREKNFKSCSDALKQNAQLRADLAAAREEIQSLRSKLQS